MTRLLIRDQRAAEAAAPELMRVFFDFKDFRLRLDDLSPVHYDVGLDRLDPGGRKWAQTQRIYGVDRKGMLIIYERRWVHSSVQAGLRASMVDRFVATFAKPLNAVPGRIEVGFVKK